jgi:hypothetical protein
MAEASLSLLGAALNRLGYHHGWAACHKTIGQRIPSSSLLTGKHRSKGDGIRWVSLSSM